MTRKRLTRTFLAGVKCLFLSLPLSFLLGCHTFPQNKHPIEKSLEECMDKSKCVTLEMSNCLTTANKKWEEEIDKYYKLLMDTLPGESRIALEKSQSAWVKFRDLEFEAIPGIYTGIPGSYQGPTFREHEMGILSARALSLKAYYDQTKDDERILR